ncbi:MAG: cytosine permease [Lachnospiraceae bacterium]|nr:cytosine permease [Lachnospiraceae bacterium]
MSDKKAKKLNIETRTLERVTNEERKSWLSVAAIEAGVLICVPSLMLGGMLAGAMPMNQALLAGTVGYVIAVLLTAVIGMEGYDLGIPLCVLSLSSFGKKGGKYVATTLLVLSLMGWFAVQAYVCGSAFSNMLSGFLRIEVPVGVSVLVWGIIMLLTAVYGIDALKWLNYAAVPALVLVTMLGCFLAVQKFSLSGLDTPVAQTMTFLGGVGLTFSFNATGMVIAPDYTRYNKSRKDAAKSMILGILPAGLLMFYMGAVMSKLTGLYDISLIMGEVGIPILGIVVLILATWTSNTTNAYSAGISMVMLFNLKDDKRAVTTLVAGVAGTILALLGLSSYFEEVLNVLGYAFAPMAGILIADYWILMKGRPESWKETPGVDISGLVSWCIGVVVSVAIPYGLPVLNGLIVAGAVYWVMRRMLTRV